ncbi:hypothetical protein M5D96_007470 [Drosophila gunungcola]|uniref:Uncharacterized protein n=1 Tax=Drosophila gunungcola TaxID=103775 RepID=A0A9P9YN19_9MUSC|nr:hypothetical protein M5D96_007470 [Drosophila gunungcola]
MDRRYLYLLLALSFLDLSCGCPEGYVFNKKSGRCYAEPTTKPPVECRRGSYWLSSKQRCVKLSQIMTGYFPEKKAIRSPEKMKKCPTGFISLRNMCVKEKKDASDLKSYLLEPEGNFQLLFKEKTV